MSILRQLFVCQQSLLIVHSRNCELIDDLLLVRQTIEAMIMMVPDEPQSHPTPRPVLKKKTGAKKLAKMVPVGQLNGFKGPVRMDDDYDF